MKVAESIYLLQICLCIERGQSGNIMCVAFAVVIMYQRDGMSNYIHTVCQGSGVPPYPLRVEGYPPPKRAGSVQLLNGSALMALISIIQ